MALPEARGLWGHIARLRLAEGDREGAARARLAARVAGPIHSRPRSPYPRILLKTGTVHYLIMLEWKGKPSPAGEACNEAAPNSDSTTDLAKVNCGNCKRTKLFRQAVDDAERAAEIQAAESA